MSYLIILSLISLGIVLGVTFIVALLFRKVVPTNMVHIVQSKGSNFDLSLSGYQAYDKERLPFELDLTAFFRIGDTNMAAERVPNIETLKHQLQAVMQGAVRKILASHEINKIMEDRAIFGQQFTDEVRTELANWGVEPVKNMELMDIRDAQGSRVIANIMAKKSSQIEMESRTVVAGNQQTAQEAEIVAQQAVDIKKQEALQQVGERTAEADKAVGIAQQKAQQEIKEQEAVTRQKEMEIIKVSQVQQAEIDKSSAIIAAEQQKEVTIQEASGKLEAAKLEAQGIQAKGEAEGKAQQAILMAPVEAQIKLADKISTNEGYMNYLVAIEGLKAAQAIGIKQAEALAKADVKVIANAGSATQGATSAMQLFTPQGGLTLGAMLESISQTPRGKDLLDALSQRLKGQVANDELKTVSSAEPKQVESGT